MSSPRRVGVFGTKALTESLHACSSHTSLQHKAVKDDGGQKGAKRSVVPAHDLQSHESFRLKSGDPKTADFIKKNCKFISFDASTCSRQRIPKKNKSLSCPDRTTKAVERGAARDTVDRRPDSGNIATLGPRRTCQDVGRVHGCAMVSGELQAASGAFLRFVCSQIAQ